MNSKIGVITFWLCCLFWPRLAETQEDPSKATAVDAINIGHAGTWYDPMTSGQGMSFEVLSSTQQLGLAWLTFAAGSPDKATHAGQRWFTGLGPISGNSADLVLYDTQGGEFGQPGGTQGTNEVGTAHINFSSCSQATLDTVRGGDFEDDSLFAFGNWHLEPIIDDDAL